MAGSSPLMRLPLELRELVYSHYFEPDKSPPDDYFGGGKYKFRFELLRVCKSVYLEAQTVWRRENVFVRIETPWPQAVHHMPTEGLVPIVAIGSPAATFPHDHALISISAPTHHHYADAENSIVLLLHDLPLFCQVWYYSALSHADLNSQLAASFALRDPYYSADPKPVALALQRKMLLPFGVVRGLYRVEFEGPWNDGVKAELELKMKEENPTVQKCCEDAIGLMEQGDTLLAASPARNAEAALELFKKAFYAIHIIIDGRARRVMADGFFYDYILTGRFSGQAAATIRIILRIRLVARTVLAYLHMQESLEAAFWGMRTVRIMRQALDAEFEDFLGDFVGSGDTGLIYARTAIAISLLERSGPANWKENIDCKDVAEADSELLWELAAKNLKSVRREAEKNRALDEAKGFGVMVPPSLFAKGRMSDEKSAADSLRHMHLADVEE
ncbi:hypothetical protein K458DRAFT_490342 [Lentithecium fluviatile CBS 122367]|uniref:Uncharacterized protein n=1 Tax=Lentithecium fluviatile CBS 122367 TaxID=1168545 RepID=A0A6G1INY2_9PLEO|nr:hypothetical protein K458DRAFT_490342 [Lentithecium fluviatile CBS 122367]